MKYFFKFLGLIGLVILTVTAFSLANQPELSSDEPIEFDENTHEIIARGNAELVSDNAIIRAGEIRFDRESCDIMGTDNVVINTEGMRLLTESARYNAGDGRLDVTEFRAGEPPIFISGCGACGTINDLQIDTPIVILGEPDAISPNLIALRAELKNAQDECTPTQVIGHHILFRIGRIPFFYLPYFSHTAREIPVLLSNENGNDNKLGRYTRNAVLFEVNPYIKLGALIDYYSHRGFLAGPATIYRRCDACYDIDGIFQSGFIHDTGTKSELGLDSLGQPIGRDRYFIEWHHQQNITEDLQITGQLRKWSDSASLRDFRPKLFNNDQDPDNFAEAVYSGPNYFLTAFTRFSPNNFQDIEQRLPELNFNLLPTRIGCTPVFNTVDAKVAHLREHSPRTNITLESTRMDVFYGLHAPIYVNEALTFTPLLGGEINEYFDKNTSAGTYTRYRGQIGFDAQFNAYAQWDYKSCIWGIDGLRHIVRPIVNYRFIPEAHSGKGPVPKIDRRVFTTNISPIELAYLRDVDTARERHIVRFGLESMLETRAPCYGSRELASLKMYQDYLFKENHLGDHWSFWYTEFAYAPAYWINFKLYDRVNVNNFTLNEINTSVCLTDARFWTLSYSINALHHRRHQHYIDAGLHITPRTSIRGRCRYDFKLHEVTEAIGSITTRLGNAWLAELQIIHREKAVRESNWEVALLFNLLPINANIIPIKL